MEALRKHDNFEAIVEGSPLPIVTVDRRGLVQAWNRAAEELFGFTREEVLGRPAPVVARARIEDALEVLGAVEAGGAVHSQEVRGVHKDGSELDLALFASPLRGDQGEVLGAVVLLTDISDNKRKELRAEETARFREHFVGIVGHDLRNPLTAILTSTQLLLRYGKLDGRQARVVERIASSADRMARMIDDLLDFARTRLGGGFPIQPQRLDLREVTAQAVEELLFAHPGRVVQVDPQGDLWGSWDPDRMAQAIGNLVGNALQHSPAEAPVEVALRGDTEVVEFSIHNGGPPIPPGVLPHLFEPGRRGDARSGGLGLGLFIVQQILLAHGGSIEARSSEEEGTTFTAVLPRKARRKV